VANDEFTSMIYWAIVMRIAPKDRQAVLNFLQNLGVRILFQTTDHSPLRVIRCGTPEQFSESQARNFWGPGDDNGFCH